jgi:ABC-type multidrug transport system fused ATPase/permease subunit
VNLIPRFYDHTDGEIKIHGRDIRSFDRKSLLDRIAVVPQKAVLFSGSIRENLKYGNASATEEELWRALELAQARDVVEGKDGKLDFELEQNGRNLSGGQRQRLTIARALVKHSDLLILDDSASALDFKTEANLRSAILSLPATVFWVSQRASSIMHADQILVLDDGKLAGVGTHEELLMHNNVYQEIYYSQFPEERKEA